MYVAVWIHTADLVTPYKLQCACDFCKYLSLVAMMVEIDRYSFVVYS